MWRWYRWVPLLLVVLAVLVGTSEAVLRAALPCEEARLKCAYRTGCGSALQNYLVSCSALIHGPATAVCPESCQHALIALTSTPEGQDLMTCECSDEYCLESKQRVEVCRPQVVIANKNESVVSCTVAQWICAADALCSTALDYYNRFCRLMFHGKKCTHRCMNSISILRRQEKAAKLNTCRCDGLEDYDCPLIQSNMARLCFHKPLETPPPSVSLGDTETNVIFDTVSTSGAHRCLTWPAAVAPFTIVALMVVSAVT